MVGPFIDHVSWNLPLVWLSFLD